MQPGTELGVTTEAFQALVNTEIGFLDHVASILLVTREPEGQGVGVGIRSADQLFESAVIATLCFFDQFVNRMRRHVMYLAVWTSHWTFGLRPRQKQRAYSGRAGGQRVPKSNFWGGGPRTAPGAPAH